jgi:hypothetical protein
MNRPWIGKVMSLFVAPVERGGDSRPMYQRLAIPYSFKPELSVPEAMVAAIGAFLRIFLGSILFGVYGWNALVLWNSIRSLFWRVVAIPPLILVFLVLFAALMAAITAMVRKLTPARGSTRRV